jgi:hypothetical protein
MLSWPLATILFAQAAADPKEVQAMRDAARLSRPKFLGTDLTVILGVFLGLSALLFFWAFFLRKRPKHSRGALVAEKSEKTSPHAAGNPGKRKRRKRRPDHPDNWGRNPTLGETGGLPPARAGDPGATPPESESPTAR